MRILHISSYDNSGGAARAAFRLHKGLQGSGIDSKMLVQEKLTNDDSVIGPKSNIAEAVAHFRTSADHLPKLLYRHRKPTIYHLEWQPDFLVRKVQSFKPHVVHLHWICRGFVNVKTLAQLDKPLVWTLHDMWPFTGGCHYVGNCERYQKACGKCPQLGSRQRIDLSWWTYKRKAKFWKNLNLISVAPSRWIKNCARQSALFNPIHIEVIPYGIDNSRFRPMDRAYARNLLNLPQDKKLILFGAINATSDKRKGFDFLSPALRNLSNSTNCKKAELVIFGASKPIAPPDFGMKINYLGKLNDEISLSLVYLASDVFVIPSREDNLPNTIMEAMACGTPCVGFDVGGIPEMITHKKNGYLAKALDIMDLSKGISWVLDDNKNWMMLSQAARKKVKEEYGIMNVVNQHADLYQSLFAKKIY